ncbi:MAG: carbohydrate ABC transporter permease [Anaerolineaceae bacterium]|jgi:raffinose/stachyose/melibiose transport system permease protein|nr:carbohydrate ABC transporter permease [Anaerolineaceae bacterium]
MFGKLKLYQKVLIETCLIITSAIWLYPLLQSVKKSLAVNGLGNYYLVLTSPRIDVVRCVINSFFIAVSVSLVVLVLVTLAAFAFSKMDFWGKDFLYNAVLVCLTISFVAVMTPLFFTIKSLGLMNSYFSLILPMVAFQAPFLLLILKNYFDTIPNDLLEAANIDGASSLQALLLIMVPLGKPALVNVVMLGFINSWNEYSIPLLFVSQKKMYTVTLATTFFTGTQFQTPDMVAQLYATLILMTIPSILIYIFAQRYMQAGLTAGAVKS